MASQVPLDGNTDPVVGEGMDVDEGDTTVRVPAIDPAPPGKVKPNRPVPATLFAGPYRSTFALKVAATTPEVMECLKHVNCSYLSTPGMAPTLLQLKQHAHSLTVLIKHMTISTAQAVIDNRNISSEGTGEFHQNESYDWLNDLSKPYDNPDRHHQMPLTSLLNTIKPDDSRSRSYANICPLHPADVRTLKNGLSLPYATHQSLIEHANEILELLDHEYSAKGGLLSILPPKEQTEDREKAETTLLGQLILYVSRLVQRLHELEREYANALDVIKGEAAVPHQALSKLGPHGRKPREMVYPQDRFVLVNAGDDVWQFLSNEFERKEIDEAEKDRERRALGISGDALWEEKDGVEFARGITTLDVTTRYYRLRGDPLKTVFVIPAYQEHPGTKVTRETERQPTVVSVVKPVWPERVSTWELKKRSDMEELKILREKFAEKEKELELAQDTVKGVYFDRQNKAEELRKLKGTENQALKDAQAEVARLKALLHDPVNESHLQVAAEIEKAQKAKEEAEATTQAYLEKQAALEQEHQKAKEVTQQKEQLKAREEARLKKAEAELQERKSKIMERDADVARAANLTQDKLKAIWKKQITDQQILHEFLKRNEAHILLAGVKPSEEDRQKGAAIAEQLIGDADIEMMQ
jgi:hypothetical protein